MDKFNSYINCWFCKKNCVKPVTLPCCHSFCTTCFDSSIVYLNQDGYCPNCRFYFKKSQIKEDQPSYDFIRRIIKGETIPQKYLPKFKSNFLQLPFIPKHYTEKYRRNVRGELKIHLFCRKGDLKSVTTFIQSNQNINATDYAGWTPLHEAVLKKRLDIVVLLVKWGAIIDSPGDYFQTPLHKAAVVENKDIVTFLLKNGANKDALDLFGNRPTDLSDSEEVKALIENYKECPKKVLPLSFVSKCVVALCLNIDLESENLLKECKNVLLVNNVESKHITHLIVKRTQKVCLEILQCMLQGTIILPQEWISGFIESGIVLPNNTETISFIVNDETLNKGIQNSLISHRLNEPKLFSGINFFIDTVGLPVEICGISFDIQLLKKLITLGGGKILTRLPTPKEKEFIQYLYPYHASNCMKMKRCSDIILKCDLSSTNTISYNMEELKAMTFEWLIKAIINYEIKCDRFMVDL